MRSASSSATWGSRPPAAIRRWQSRTPDPRLADLARRLGPARLAKAYAAVEEARQALDGNVSFKAVADWVALEL